MSSHNIPFFLVDAFTLGTRSFTGNPAAVCVLPPKSSQQEKFVNIDHLLAQLSTSSSNTDIVPKMQLPSSLIPPERHSSTLLLTETETTLILQKIATEMQQSETVFVQQISQEGCEEQHDEQEQINRHQVFLIRWFTPATEVMLCGHATLAASHCLFSEKRDDGKFLLAPDAKVIEFISPSYGRKYRVFRGDPTTSSSSTELQSSSLAKTATYSLQFPNNKPSRVDFRDEQDYSHKVYRAITQTVSVDGAPCCDKRHILTMWYHTNSRKYIVEADSPRTIRDLKVDVKQLHSLLSSDRVFSVTFTARRGHKQQEQDESCEDYNDPQYGDVVAVSRHFAPWVGIDEDPVTGAAHCSVGPMWVERLLSSSSKMIQTESKTEEEQPEKSSSVSASATTQTQPQLQKQNAFFTFFQAYPGRGGILRLRVENDDKTVTLNGSANTVVSGDLNLTADDVRGVLKKKENKKKDSTM